MDAWEEKKHPRGEGGKFAKTFSAHVKAAEKHKAKKEKAEERARNSKAALLKQASEAGASAKKRWTKAQIKASLEKHFGAKAQSKETPKPASPFVVEQAPEFRPRKGRPIGGEAQNYVLEHGRKTGNEHLVAVGKNGKHFPAVSGTKSGVGVTPELMAALKNPEESVVLHHNHPSNRAISKQDISMLSYPGAASVWAHGHGGLNTRAELAKNANDIALGSQGAQKLWNAASVAENVISNAVREKLKTVPMSSSGPFLEDINAMHADLVNRALAEAGIINYHSSGNADATIKRFELGSFLGKASALAPMRKAARAAAKEFYGNQEPNSSNDRPANPVRHAGELGTVLSGTEKAPKGNAAKARNDKAGRKSHSREKGLAA